MKVHNRFLATILAWFLAASVMVTPLLAQNSSRATSGSTPPAAAPKSGPLRAWFQSAFGKQSPSEEEPLDEERPPVPSSKGKIPPSSKMPSIGKMPPYGNPSQRSDGTQRPVLTKQGSSAGNSLRDIARNACICHPDARRTLLAALNDRTETTRMAALQAILADSSYVCNDCGRSPCADDVVAQMLADMAFARNSTGGWLEPSEKIRHAAREALRRSHQLRAGDVAGPGQQIAPQPQAGTFVSEDEAISPPRPQRQTGASLEPKRSLLQDAPTPDDRPLTDSSANSGPVRMQLNNTSRGVGFVVPGRGGKFSTPPSNSPQYPSTDVPPPSPEPVVSAPSKSNINNVTKPKSTVSNTPPANPIESGIAPRPQVKSTPRLVVTNDEPVSPPRSVTNEESRPIADPEPVAAAVSPSTGISNRTTVQTPSPSTTTSTPSTSGQTSSRRVKPQAAQPSIGSSPVAESGPIPDAVTPAVSTKPAPVAVPSKTTPDNVTPLEAPEATDAKSGEPAVAPPQGNGPKLGPAAMSKGPKSASTGSTAVFRTARATTATPSATATVSDDTSKGPVWVKD